MKRAAAMVLTALLIARAAWACQPATPQRHDIDSNLVGVDMTPPGWERPPSVGLSNRGHGDVGCITGNDNRCEGIGSVFIEVAARDDRAPAASMGYRVRVVSGKPPAGFTAPEHDVRPLGTVGIPMPWRDGANDGQEAFSFVLALAPVDLAGNVGETALLTVSDPGTSGCAVAGTGLTAPWPALLLALIVRGAWRRHRRR